MVEESQIVGNETLRMFLKDFAVILITKITKEEILILKGVLDPILRLIGSDDIP